MPNGRLGGDGTPSLSVASILSACHAACPVFHPIRAYRSSSVRPILPPSSRLRFPKPLSVGRHTFPLRALRRVDKEGCHLSQLCEMGLRGFHLDVMLDACFTRNLRKNTVTQHTTASRRKWRSHAWLGPRE